MPRSRVAKVITVGTAGLVGLVVAGILVASLVLQGPRLGALIQGALPKNRGQMEIGGVTWSLRALVDLVTDAPSPITVDGLRILDPEGTVVLDVPHLEARVKLRTLIGGSFSIHDLKVGKALWRFAQMKNENKIGFLAALASKEAPAPPPPTDAPKKPQGPGSFFQIVNGELDDLNAIFDFPGSWGLELRHAHANASLIQSSVDPAHPIFGFDAGPVVAEGGGWLRILDDNLLPFDKVVINRVSTTQDRADDIFLDLREAKTGKTSLVGKGYFTGIYGETSVPGIDLHAEFHDAADAFNQVLVGKKIEGVALGGDAAFANLDLHDTFAALKVAAQFGGLDADYAPYRVRNIGFGLSFDGGAMKVGVHDFGLEAPGGGTLALNAELDATAMKLAGDLRLDGFTTDDFVPEELREMAGGTVSGKLHADANLQLGSVAVRGLNLRLDRRKKAGLPGWVRVRGDTTLSAERVRTPGLTIEVEGARATTTGEVRLARQLVSLGLDVFAFDLTRLLKSLRLPALATEARITAKVDGPLSSPNATGEASVKGLAVGDRKIPDLRAKFGMSKGTARLDSLSGGLFGGRVDAHGTLRLFNKSTSHPLRSPIANADLTVTNADLAQASGLDILSGRVSLAAHLEGPLDHPVATVKIPRGQEVNVAGEALSVGPADVRWENDALAIRTLHVKRTAGGTVDVTGNVTATGAMALDVILDGVRLAGLPGTDAPEIGLDGTLSAKLHVSGTAETPRVSGGIDLRNVVAHGVPLGAGHLEIAAPANPADPRAPHRLTGDLFKRFQLAATAALTPAGPVVHGSVEWNDLVLEALLPELHDISEGQGLASGRVQVDMEPNRPLAIDALLTKLAVSLSRAVDAGPGEPTTQRIHVSAKDPLHVAMVGPRITVDPTRLATDGGDLKISGGLDGDAITGKLDGHLDLELLQVFLRGHIDKIAGAVDLSVAVGGTIQTPQIKGRVAVQQPIVFKPTAFDVPVSIDGGTFVLDPSAVTLGSLAVTVDGATTRLSGRVTLGAGFTPQQVDATFAGEVSAQLLASVAGAAVSDASGRARVKAEVHGPFGAPMLRAWLGLGTINFRLRDTGNQVEVQSGVVEVSNQGLVLRDVRVLIDDQGKLLIGASGVRPGRVQFKRLVPLEIGAVDFPLHGERLVYRSPGTFEINDLAFDFDLTGDMDDGFELGGEVRIIAGRYTQDFGFSNLVLRPRVNESAVEPFYEGKPLLEDLALDLSVRTVGDAFVVQNNIAPEIHIDVALHVGGTLSEPLLAGEVRPTDGRFHIPALRGDFDLVANVNHITFAPTKSLADGETPEMNLEAINPVVDAAGVEHIVRMRIHGPVREMQIDLSTDDGLDRSQTALLLLTGRTSSVNDRQTTANPTVGANFNTGIDIAGQATRDVVANLMEPIIGDTFERAVGLQLRLTVGPDGFEGRLRKRISRYTNFQADVLRGFQGSNRFSLQLDQWFLDYVSLGFGLQQVTIAQTQGLAQENQPTNWNLELRWDFPIRR